MARRTTRRNSPIGLGEPITLALIGAGALKAATAFAPLAIPALTNLFGEKKKETFHFAPGTYERDYAAVLEAKKQEALAQQQVQQIQQVEQAKQNQNRTALIYGAVGLGVLVIGAIAVAALTRSKKEA